MYAFIRKLPICFGESPAQTAVSERNVNMFTSIKRVATDDLAHVEKDRDVQVPQFDDAQRGLLLLRLGDGRAKIEPVTRHD